MNVPGIRALTDLRDRAQLQAQVRRLEDALAVSEAVVAGLGEANQLLGQGLRVVRNDLELAYRRIAELRETVQKLETANEELSALLENRAGPGLEPAPAGPTHPQCLNAARLICAYCAPKFGMPVRAVVVPR